MVICYITSPFYIRVCAQLLIMIRMLEAVNFCKVFFQLCIYIGSFVGTELYTVVICYITSPFYIRVCAQLLIMIL